ncbi:hypothetical protein RHMOL_Rhmol04G0191200 [Rhododendron molle]|uniref:Uncharacterized protein n=1 Tax=Rhododendron molle TaxID=49168 RepID=A0ACC0P3B8_RHOML|nr:hypothetical protein RHMOL_Rhmol04G0191200 [Rhododendron molle]
MGSSPRKCVPSPKGKTKGMLSLLKEEVVSINLKGKYNLPKGSKLVQAPPPEEHCARSDKRQHFGMVSSTHA